MARVKVGKDAHCPDIMWHYVKDMDAKAVAKIWAQIHDVCTLTTANTELTRSYEPKVGSDTVLYILPKSHCSIIIH